MAGAVFNTDNDKAERKALFQLFWDRMTPAMATAHMRSVLDDLEAVLADNGLLGVNLYDKPLSIALPIHGLNVAEGVQSGACAAFCAHAPSRPPRRRRDHAAHHHARHDARLLVPRALRARLVSVPEDQPPVSRHERRAPCGSRGAAER